MYRSPMRARFTFGLSVVSGEKIACTRLKIERHGSVAKPGTTRPSCAFS
jgi:hypothetical protein